MTDNDRQRNTMSTLMRLVLTTMLLIPVLATADEERFPKFSLRLAGEAGIMAIGDINTTLKSFNNNEQFDYIRKNNPDWAAVQGTIRTLNNFLGNWAGELRMDLSRRIGLGIEISGAVHKRNESSLTLLKLYTETWT